MTRETTPPYSHVKVLQFKAAEVNEERRRVSGYASTPDLDRQGERILPEAFAYSLGTYLRNPVVTWSHEWWEMPIGKTVQAEVRPDGLWVEIEIAKTAEGNKVWEGITQGLVRSLSVGFDGRYTDEWGYWEQVAEAERKMGYDEYQSHVDQGQRWVWTKVALWEIAVVPLPANANATFGIAKGLGLPEPPRGPLAAKTATSFADLPAAPEETAWDAGASETRVREWAGGPNKDDIDWEKYRKRFFWYDPDNAEGFGGYKLPFADIVDGDLRAVWRGVAAAMGALLGARGGVDIPADERKAVYNHIKRYYAKFEKDPPDFKGDWPENLKAVTFRAGEFEILEELRALEDAQRLKHAATSLSNISRHWVTEGGAPSAEVVTDAVSAITAASEVAKAGRVLSAANRSAVEQAIAALQDVLARDDESRANQDSDKGLTLAALLARVPVQDTPTDVDNTSAGGVEGAQPETLAALLGVS